MNPIEAPCETHEQQIQENSRDIAELQTEIRFKEKRIDGLNRKMDKMEQKIDNLNDNVNKLVQKSIEGDSDIEKRLIAMETKLSENEKAVQDNRNRFTLIISVITIFFTALTFIFNFILK